MVPLVVRAFGRHSGLALATGKVEECSVVAVVLGLREPDA